MDKLGEEKHLSDSIYQAVGIGSGPSGLKTQNQLKNKTLTPAQSFR